ncbi:uncharacterized protein LOC130415680 isoform X2 [Triplophysa dalaica]|uniref:uncharacterized protein LOC130415680 isoform X2 n=1 Tax=Triplophysa dalaica TaxID=1582913 RepID=UPI0024DF9258|nr:uncharacterized protein LOC130415680 isoform X2 [Triplophysa dalaica]
MKKYIFNLILSVSISAQCLMCAFTVNMTVQHEENVTLSCNVNSSSGVAWYRLSSDKMTLLISASRGKLKKNNFIIVHSMDESHFQLKEGNSTESVSFRIIRAGEADIGLYYCAVGISEKGMQFGTPVRLTFSDTKRGGFSHTANSVGCRTLSICAYAACGLSGVICMCVLFYRQVLCVSCGKENSNSEAADVQYASLRFVRPSRAAVPASVNGGQSPDVEPGLVVHC